MYCIKPEPINNFISNTQIEVKEIRGSRIVKSFFKEKCIEVGAKILLLEKQNDEILLMTEKEKIYINLSESKNILGIPI